MKNDEPSFTGERLHASDALFSVDLVRHRAAYHHALEVARERGRERGALRLLELGSGTGYGAAELAEADRALLDRIVAVDRVPPAPAARAHRVGFIRADLTALPLRERAFDLVVSFQVIEHLEDPHPYLQAMAARLHPGGVALLSTPNRLNSDGENPFHVHEYTAQELRDLLGQHFAQVEMLGVSATGEALAYHEARLARIRRITRLDPLRLRRVLPTTLVEWLFARFAILVRRGLADGAGLPQVDLSQFPIEPAHPKSLDLLARCSSPRT